WVLWAGAGPERPRAWLLAGLAVGLASPPRLWAAFRAVPPAVLILAQAPRDLGAALRRGMSFALGCAPGILLMLYYNYLRFGSLFAFFVRPAALGTLGDMFVPW